MKRVWMGVTAVSAIAAVVSGYYLFKSNGFAQGGLQTPPVEIALKDTYDVPAADAQTEAIVAASQTFLDLLSPEERDLAVYSFDDSTQRANWSNFPTGPVQRGGVMRGNLTAEQNAAMDAVLAEVLSAEGMNNTRYQLAAEETLDDGNDGGPDFGEEYYFMSFLGEPSADAPWMLQFGGHHLAYNVTIFGPNLSFSPMLTGGEPLNISYDGEQKFITAKETAAAQAFMDSLDDVQTDTATISDTPINLLAGPGEYGTTISPEGIIGADLTENQRTLLLAVIAARLGFINDDDFGAKMKAVSDELDQTYFGWWGPQGTLGAAYFRVTGPSLVIEYSPQDLGGDPTDHAHNMYRDPTNDYGTAWIATK